jgi:hypothetical protein
MYRLKGGIMVPAGGSSLSWIGVRRYIDAEGTKGMGRQGHKMQSQYHLMNL